jgi:hypothetical protein
MSQGGRDPCAALQSLIGDVEVPADDAMRVRPAKPSSERRRLGAAPGRDGCVR